MDILCWGIVLLCGFLSVLWMNKKGAKLIAGYNTASQEEKEKYNLNRLYKVMGGGMALITIQLIIFLLYDFELPNSLHWIMPWGYLWTILWMVILTNTICEAK